MIIVYYFRDKMIYKGKNEGRHSPNVATLYTTFQQAGNILFSSLRKLGNTLLFTENDEKALGSASDQTVTHER